MPKERERKPVDQWGNEAIPPGSSRDIMLDVSESYSGMTVQIPIHIRRGSEEGPAVFVTAALHGDEINGTGAIRQLIQDEKFSPIRGSVVLVPVLNMLGFDRHSRYLPDRRDLNRSFPGSATGSLASRLANRIFDQIISRCDYGIDLHTAAVRRTNYPNVRADLSDPKVKQLARAFGCEITLNTKGPRGSLRREACLAGCPTIVMEGGEVWKVEPGIVESAARGVNNVLRSLDMLKGAPQAPEFQLAIKKSKWIRAENGGFLQFHIKPGDILEKGQPLATNRTLLGHEQNMLCSPFNAVVIGMTTLPAISPGEPVGNLGQIPKGVDLSQLREQRTEIKSLERRLSGELASNILVTDPK